MPRIAGILVVTGLVTAPSTAADRRTDTDHLVIATLNAEFLWDGQSPEEGQVSFPWKNDQTKAEAHMERVANVIRALDADMVVMEEVESQAALDTLNTKFLAGEGYAAFVSNGADTFTGQDIGLLTRIDPIGSSVQRDSRKGKSGDTEKSVSKNLVARFNVGTAKVPLLDFICWPSLTIRAERKTGRLRPTPSPGLRRTSSPMDSRSWSWVTSTISTVPAAARTTWIILPSLPY